MIPILNNSGMSTSERIILREDAVRTFVPCYICVLSMSFALCYDLSMLIKAHPKNFQKGAWCLCWHFVRHQCAVNFAYPLSILACRNKIFNNTFFWLILQLTNRLNNAYVFRRFSCTLLTDPLFLQECCVCLSSYEDGAELSALPCNHHFHWTCITKWLRMNATCPLCKYNILKGSDSA